MSLDARQRIVKARFTMLLGGNGNNGVLSFFGQIATRLKLIKTDQIPTMGTNGRDLYYNEEFVNSLTDDELLFVVGHETLHCVYEHVAKWRRQGRHPKLWNVAADLVINNELTRHKIGTMPECGVFDDKYDQHWAVEAVYDDIKDKVQWVDADSMDTHMEPGEGDGECEGNDGNGKSTAKQNGEVEELSGDELSRVADDLKEAVKEAAKNTNVHKNAGSGGFGLERLCEELLEGKVDWRDVLKTQITACFENHDYTYRKYNRRNGLLNGAVLPQVIHEGEAVNIMVAIDVSGSISNDDVRVFLSELSEITEQFNDWKITMFCFADGVFGKTVKTYTSENTDDVADYTPDGCGGTSFNPIYNWLKDKQEIPEQLIIMTDGYSMDGWGDPEYCDTLWLLVNNDGSHDRPNHGIAVYYDTEEVHGKPQ